MSLESLGKSLEDQFFESLDEARAKRATEQLKSDKRRDDLRQASGLLDSTVLDTLLDQGIGPDTITAFGLFPLVWTAWASGVVEPTQRAAVVEASRQVGVVGMEALLLLARWLERRPPETLLAAWKEYAVGLRAIMADPEWRAMGATIVQRARVVASAAGGILGLFKISSAEAAVIEQLEQVFAL